MVGNDLGKLILDVLRVGGLATNATKSVGSLIELALLHPITRRFGKESKANGQDESPQELDGNGNAVRASIPAILGSIDHTVGKQDTNGNAELVT